MWKGIMSYGCPIKFPHGVFGAAAVHSQSSESSTQPFTHQWIGKGGTKTTQKCWCQHLCLDNLEVCHQRPQRCLQLLPHPTPGDEKWAVRGYRNLKVSVGNMELQVVSITMLAQNWHVFFRRSWPSKPSHISKLIKINIGLQHWERSSGCLPPVCVCMYVCMCVSVRMRVSSTCEVDENLNTWRGEAAPLGKPLQVTADKAHRRRTCLEAWAAISLASSSPSGGERNSFPGGDWQSLSLPSLWPIFGKTSITDRNHGL